MFRAVIRRRAGRPAVFSPWDFPIASVKFVQPDPDIFQNRELATATTLIIAEPLLNWCGINECLHKLIAVERSIEDLRMKGERIRDRIKRDRINSERYNAIGAEQ